MATARVDAEPAPEGGLVGFFRRLLGGASLLSLAGIMQQGVGFLLLPVYTRYLSPADYGQIEVLMVSVFLANMVVAQGMPPSLLRRLSLARDNDPERCRRAAGTALLYVAASGIGFVGLSALAAPWLGPLLFGADGYGYLVQIGGVLVAAITLISVGNSVLMAHGRVAGAVAVGLVQFGVKLSLNILLVVVLEVGFTGIIWSHLVGDAAGVLAMLWTTRRQVRWKFERAEARELCRYGRPLVAASLGYQVLSVSDRYLIRFLRPAAELGLYAVAHKFATAFYLVIVGPLSRMWEVSGLELAQEEGGAERIARIANLYLVVGGLATLGVIWIIEPALQLLVPPEFLGAEAAVGILVGAAVFTGLGEIFKVGLRVQGSSREIAVIAGATAVFNVVIGFVLIPRGGFVGAAMASLLASALLAWGACRMADRVFPVPWDRSRLTASALLLLGACALQPPLELLDPFDRMLARTALLGAYVLAAPRLLDRESREAVAERWRALRGRVLVSAGESGHA